MRQLIVKIYEKVQAPVGYLNISTVLREQLHKEALKSIGRKEWGITPSGVDICALAKIFQNALN